MVFGIIAKFAKKTVKRGVKTVRKTAKKGYKHARKTTRKVGKVVDKEANRAVKKYVPKKARKTIAKGATIVHKNLNKADKAIKKTKYVGSAYKAVAPLGPLGATRNVSAVLAGKKRVSAGLVDATRVGAVKSKVKVAKRTHAKVKRARKKK